MNDLRATKEQLAETQHALEVERSRFREAVEQKQELEKELNQLRDECAKLEARVPIGYVFVPSCAYFLCGNRRKSTGASSMRPAQKCCTLADLPLLASRNQKSRSCGMKPKRCRRRWRC